MTKNTISVIIPVYNTELYLSRCLDSILNSDYDDLEIICVNDGSEDQSLKILKEYEKKDSRVRVIDIPNGGVSNARNIGLDMASGEFIAFVDSDDWVHRQYFSVLVYIQRKTGCDIAAVKSQKVRNEVEEFPVDFIKTEIKSFYSEEVLSFDFRAYVWGKMYKRECIHELRFDERIDYGEDSSFNFELFDNKTNLISAIAFSPLYYYFTRDFSLSNNSLLLYCYLNLHKKYLCLFNSASNKQLVRIYLNELFRDALSQRYRSARDGEFDLSAEFDIVLKQATALERQNHYFPLHYSILYRTLARRPKIYELYKNSSRKIKSIFK